MQNPLAQGRTQRGFVTKETCKIASKIIFLRVSTPTGYPLQYHNCTCRCVHIRAGVHVHDQFSPHSGVHVHVLTCPDLFSIFLSPSPPSHSPPPSLSLPPYNTHTQITLDSLRKDKFFFLFSLIARDNVLSRRTRGRGRTRMMITLILNSRPLPLPRLFLPVTYIHPVLLLLFTALKRY